MLSFIYLLLFVNAVVQCVSSQPGGNCMQNGFRECEDSIGFNLETSLTEYFIAKRLPDATFLDEHCEKFVKIFDCRTRKAKNCGQNNYHFTKLGDVIKELCDKDSEARKSYIENFECINDNMEDIEKCAAKAWYFAYLQFDSNNSSKEDDRRRLCLSPYVQEEKCLLGIPRERCDESGYAIGKRLFKKIRSEECSEAFMKELTDMFGTKVQNWNWQESK